MRSASPLSAMALTSVAGDILASVKHLLDIVKYLAAPPRRHVGKLPQRQPFSAGSPAAGAPTIEASTPVAVSTAVTPTTAPTRRNSKITARSPAIPSPPPTA